MGHRHGDPGVQMGDWHGQGRGAQYSGSGWDKGSWGAKGGSGCGRGQGCGALDFTCSGYGGAPGCPENADPWFNGSADDCWSDSSGRGGGGEQPSRCKDA